MFRQRRTDLLPLWLRQNTGPVVLYNTVNLCVIVVVGYLCGYVSEQLNLVKNPLIVTPLCTTTVGLVEIVGLNCLQAGTTIKVWPMLTGCALVILAVVLFHFITVLFGAPLLESVAETFNFSSLLATLTVLPSFVVFGIDRKTWIRVYAYNRADTLTEDCVGLTTLTTIMGAWLGSFPIPLDWDRPWQVWPVTCVIGMLAGYAVGHIWCVYTVRSRALSIRKSKLG